MSEGQHSDRVKTMIPEKFKSWVPEKDSWEKWVLFKRLRGELVSVQNTMSGKEMPEVVVLKLNTEGRTAKNM